MGIARRLALGNSQEASSEGCPEASSGGISRRIVLGDIQEANSGV